MWDRECAPRRMVPKLGCGFAFPQGETKYLNLPAGPALLMAGMVGLSSIIRGDHMLENQDIRQS